ncbi:hypothetical protein AMK26_13945 [Streptomyces sp. CB03234]|nr:hypothetical protein AMK26_13945 [Streptomyces sp. CB03234]
MPRAGPEPGAVKDSGGESGDGVGVGVDPASDVGVGVGVDPASDVDVDVSWASGVGGAPGSVWSGADCGGDGTRGVGWGLDTFELRSARSGLGRDSPETGTNRGGQIDLAASM